MALSLKINKNKPIYSLCLDFPQSIEVFIEARNSIELRSFDQLSGCIITPPMISAPQNYGATAFFFSDGIRAMPAHIVE